MLRVEARNSQVPVERKPPWIKTRLRTGPAEAVPGAGAAGVGLSSSASRPASSRRSAGLIRRSSAMSITALIVLLLAAHWLHGAWVKAGPPGPGAGLAVTWPSVSWEK